jgi:hypothetical protein
MSKWEESFKKPSDNKPCHCNNSQGLFIPTRQLSALIAGILSISFCVFMTGYFLGKKVIAQQFTQLAQKEYQDDAIALSTFASNNNDASNYQDNKKSLIVTAGNSGPEESDDNLISQESVILANQDIIVTEKTDTAQYYAQLIGFGTEKAAQQFAKRTADRGIVTAVKKRISKTAKGRISYWYQVVTTTYHNKNDLLSVVDRLSKEEKLKGVCIRSC